jgi:hypothetical protein
MINYRKIAVAASLLLFGAAGCADLAVTNVNDPERERALASADDVESLVAGSYRQWWLGQQSDDSNDNSSPGLFLAAAAFEWSSTAANFGILEYSKIPRVGVTNSSTHADYGHFATAWTRNYRAIASASEGIRAFAENPALGKDLGAQNVLRLRIFGRLVQGLSHGSIALLYDRGYVVDEKVKVVDEAGAPILLGEPVGYQQVMNAAIGYLTDAITMAESADAAGITFPAEWMAHNQAVTIPRFLQLAYSMRARFRANVARTPQERAAVNWAAVLQDTQKGIKADWIDDRSFAYNNWIIQIGHIYYPATSTFGQSTLFGIGMADTSGVFQQWLAQPVSERTQLLNGQQVLIHSPDNRFPKGATLAAQQAAPGRYYGARGNNQFTRPERGSWRWSYYFNRQITTATSASASPNNSYATTWPLMRAAEIRLLAAEGLFRTGQMQAAADSINVTRVAAGLNATTAAGENTRCVPRLPNGSCGGLFEMLKWEKRMETFLTGPFLSTWYFDGRGWGDLYRGTPLQFPIPDEQIQVLGLGAAYTFGGVGGQFASPGSSYNFPGE